MIVSANSFAATFIAPFDNQYQIERKGKKLGTIRQRLAFSSNNTYSFEQHIQFKVIFFNNDLLEKSEGKWDKQLITPYRYTFKDTALRQESAANTITFNWKKYTATLSRQDKIITSAITNNTLDKLSCQLGLRIALSQNKKQWVCNFTNGKKIKKYYFTVLGNETLKTSVGTFKTLKIEQRKPSAATPSTIFWLNTAKNYLLIKLIQFKNGKEEIAAVLSKINLNKK